MARDYRKEYDRYQGTKKQLKRRAGRNRSRRDAIKSGAVKKGDGKDIHHRDNNPNNNSSGNTVVLSASSNRSFKRNKNAGHA
jgi:hypothetical protein|tara:strand:- start:142 stop:387 length:246 start_codon:yes stop_codon:yes gene_type:complete